MTVHCKLHEKRDQIFSLVDKTPAQNLNQDIDFKQAIRVPFFFEKQQELKLKVIGSNE